jgi:hypothetical protein
MIECRVNGAVVARTTDPFNATATRAGLTGYLAPAARLDNFGAVAPTTPDLSVSMSGPTFVDAGTEGVWQTTVRNIGVAPSAPTEVVITFPAAAANVAVNGATCVADGSERRCSLAPLAVGAATVLDLVASAPQQITDLVFTAALDALFQDDLGSNNGATFTSHTRPAGERVVDTFNRPDGLLGAADSGQPWVVHVGMPTIGAHTASPGSGYVLATVNSGDGSGDVTVKAVQSSDNFWVVFRLSDWGNYWRFGRWPGEPYQLQRIQGQMATVVPILTNVMAANGDLLRCVYWLEDIQCSVNGVVVARTFDGFNEQAAGVGLSAYAAPGTRFDDFRVMVAPPFLDRGVQIGGPSLVRTGDVVSWSIDLRNRSTTTLVDNEVLISRPSELQNPSVGGASCVPEGAQYRCAVGELGPGATASVTLSGTAPLTTGLMSLSASVATVAGESTVSNNAAARTTRVRPAISPTALVVDLFERPNSMGLGQADTGQTWTQLYGNIGVVNAEAAPQGGFTLATLNSGVSSADVSVVVANAASEFALILRQSDPAITGGLADTRVGHISYSRSRHINSVLPPCRSSTSSSLHLAIRSPAVSTRSASSARLTMLRSPARPIPSTGRRRAWGFPRTFLRRCDSTTSWWCIRQVVPTWASLFWRPRWPWSIRVTPFESPSETMGKARPRRPIWLQCFRRRCTSIRFPPAAQWSAARTTSRAFLGWRCSRGAARSSSWG